MPRKSEKSGERTRLVIVESPTKANTIGRFLGAGYRVDSSYGHIRDLPKSQLGIDVEHDFEPHYIIPLKARQTVKRLREEVKGSETVILATDEDREGEAIAWHLTQALNLQSPQAPKVLRIVFHEITKSAIEEALKHPRTVDEKLVDAQQARRALDRLVGYKLSPFLWRKVASRLSAGRVQSVAVRLIVDREQEIRDFKTEEYWTITAGLATEREPGKKALEAELAKIGEKAVEKFTLKNRDEAERISAELRDCNFAVGHIEKREMKKSPPSPFTTSTLQQESAKRLGFSAKKTMFVAQRLYENGFITYMRTDSVHLSAESVAGARQWLTDNLGKEYALPAPRIFKTKSKLSQEAHEAVRPTNAGATPENVSLAEASDRKLYQLIWQRFIASQMPFAVIAGTTIEILAEPKKAGEGTRYALRATGQRITFDGFLKIWHQRLLEKELPNLAEGERLALTEVTPLQHFTEPPPRYSEATLVKALEEFGIGRPSTYAPIISVIQARNYVRKEGGRFHPNEIGEVVNKVLTEHFPEIVDIGFTAAMEEELDDIARGKARWQDVIRGFYEPFAKNLDAKYQEVSKKELTTEATNEVCEKCGKPMVVRMGRFGKFLACSGFPECRNTKKIQKEGESENAAPKGTGMRCPKCPASPDPARRDNPGEIVIRRVTRGRARGKMFWGCSRYPACDYASWKNPAEVTQPEAEKQ